MKDAVLTTPEPDLRALPAEAAHAVAEAAEAQHRVVSSLPRDHPAWQRDVVSISARARELLARLPRAVMRVLTFWDHVRRSVTITGRTLEIDPSGSYRLR